MELCSTKKYYTAVKNPCFPIFWSCYSNVVNFPIKSLIFEFGKFIKYYNETGVRGSISTLRQKSLFSYFGPFYSNVVNFPIKFCYFAIKTTYFPFSANVLGNAIKLWSLKGCYFAVKNPLFSCFSSFCRIIKIVVIVIRLVVTLCFRIWNL